MFRKYLPLLFFAALLVLSVLIVKPLFQALFFGAFLAYLCYPIYKWLLKKMQQKTIAALLVCLLIILLLVLPGFFFVKTLVQETYVIYLIVKQRLALGIFGGCSYGFCDLLREITSNVEVRYQIQEAVAWTTKWIVNKASAVLVSIPKIVLNLIVMLAALFYFLKEGEGIIARLGEYVKMRDGKYRRLQSRLKDIIHGITFGYLLLAFVQGVLAALGFFIFGISSPLFWGLVVAILALIPILGSTLIWVPASLILIFDGVFQNNSSLIFMGIGLAIYSFVFVSSIDNLVRPKVIGEKANIHPLLILIGIFGGMFVFGPLGVIIGPLLLSLTFVILDVYLRDNA